MLLVDVLAFKASLQFYLTFPGPADVVWMFSKQEQAPLTKPGFWIHSVFLYLYLALSYEVSTGYITVGWEWKYIEKGCLSGKPSFGTSLHVVCSGELKFNIWHSTLTNHQINISIYISTSPGCFRTSLIS